MTYTIALPEAQPRTYTRLADAVKFADKRALDLGIELEVVDSESSTVAHLTSPKAIKNRETGEHFTPWTRLEVPKFSARSFETHYVAYTRKRIEATVMRAHDKDAPTPWRVVDGRTGNFRDVKNTTESRKLLTQMKNGLQL